MEFQPEKGVGRLNLGCPGALLTHAHTLPGTWSPKSKNDALSAYLPGALPLHSFYTCSLLPVQSFLAAKPDFLLRTFFFNFQTWRKVAIVLWTLALETISLARTTAETIALRGHKLLGAASPNILPHGRGSACEDSFSRGHCLQRPWNPHTTSRTGQGLHWRSCLSLSANWQQKEQ